MSQAARNMGDAQVLREDFLSAASVTANGGFLVGAPTFNNGIVLDGAADKVQLVTAIYGVKSVAIELTAASTTEDIIDLDGGTHTIEVSNGTITATGFSSPTIYVDGVVTSTLTTAKSLITITTDTAFLVTSPITIGGQAGTFLEGTISRFSLFTETLSTDEVLDDFEKDTYKELDESKFLLSIPLITTYNDGSNDVTKNLGSAGNEVRWGDGSTASGQPTLLRTVGIRQRGVRFDGANDHLEVEDSTSNTFGFDGSTDFSIVFMMQTTQGGAGNKAMLYKRASRGWVIQLATDGSMDFFIDTTAGNSNFKSALAVNDGKLHHIVLTWRASDDKRRTYIDGLIDANSPSAARTQSFDQTGLDLFIGTTDALASDYDGDLGAIRIADFELTPRQIRWLCKRDFQSLNIV